ncbi:ParB family chromosome partitioning protein [Deinococcus metalli]|uniref:ParB family chromosome partitioning protein n=1 Tax=Deinococcus metalli TaxID=1141878 RepID=A0A7W8KCR7_9DEIO|nr:ParB/RepB/Spo0J family partition protein [Deinococcus metalli]MBB5375807.1 ParB family chromosome partitioning protein [Deinococcus metalli]GHF36882.1 hypothetical protein GCM10017781_11960 [Deinococcus metalli]
MIGARLTGLVASVDDLSQPATTTVPVGSLRPGVFQPRVHFDEATLSDLARSIRQQGILQPLLVRPEAGGHYEIVAGERRWRAAQLAGLDEVPVLIRTLNDAEARMAAAVENLQRENLNVIEEVRARLQVAAATLDVPESEAVARMFALDRHPEAAPDLVAALDAAFGSLGRETWRSFIRNRAAVLNLPPDVQAAVREGLDYRKALIIGRVKDAGERLTLLERTQSGITVQELRALVSGPRVPAHPTPDDPWTTVGRHLLDAQSRARLDHRKRSQVEKLLRQLEALLEA